MKLQVDEFGMLLTFNSPQTTWFCRDWDRRRASRYYRRCCSSALHWPPHPGACIHCCSIWSSLLRSCWAEKVHLLRLAKKQHEMLWICLVYLRMPFKWVARKRMRRCDESNNHTLWGVENPANVHRKDNKKDKRARAELFDNLSKGPNLEQNLSRAPNSRRAFQWVHSACLQSCLRFSFRLSLSEILLLCRGS